MASHEAQRTNHRRMSKENETLQEYIAKHPFKGPFNPIPRFNFEGRQIEWFWKNDRCYATDVPANDGRNVGKIYISEETGEIVGCCLYVDCGLRTELAVFGSESALEVLKEHNAQRSIAETTA